MYNIYNFGTCQFAAWNIKAPSKNKLNFFTIYVVPKIEKNIYNNKLINSHVQYKFH